jgi:hypothetical protein
MPIPPDTRACLTCGEMLRGRIDKKFCDDYCRSAYNNRQYQENRGLSFIRKVNNVLRKNRRILEELMPAGAEAQTIPRARLLKKGFNFNYLTCIHPKEGMLYHSCYEYGYILVEKDSFYVVRRLEMLK